VTFTRPEVVFTVELSEKEMKALDVIVGSYSLIHTPGAGTPTVRSGVKAPYAEETRALYRVLTEARREAGV
jgi:hypothetical protein